MPLQITPNVSVVKDKDGIVRQIHHLQQPFFAAAVAGGNPRDLARTYLGEVASIYSLDSSFLSTLDQPVGDTITAEAVRLRFGEQSSLLETTVVSYSQTRWSLPIWEGRSWHRDPGRPAASNEFPQHDPYESHLPPAIEKPEVSAERN